MAQPSLPSIGKVICGVDCKTKEHCIMHHSSLMHHRIVKDHQLFVPRCCSSSVSFCRYFFTCVSSSIILYLRTCLLQPLCTLITIPYLAYNLIVPNVPNRVGVSDRFASFFVVHIFLGEFPKTPLTLYEHPLSTCLLQPMYLNDYTLSNIQSYCTKL